MTALTLANAAKVAGISRATIYRLASEGKLSVTVDGRGRKVVDAAELLRLFPKSQGETVGTDRPRQAETGSSLGETLVELKATREMLEATRATLELERAEKARLLGIVENQTRLLEDKSQKGVGEVFNATGYFTVGLLVILVAVVAILALSRALR